MHNLMIVDNLEDYQDNKFNKKNTIKLSTDKPDKETLITIMDKPGEFYFACTVQSHAQNGHKIIIQVI